MSYIEMAAEIRGSVPNLAFDAARKFVQRAWSDIRRQNLWSFQLYDRYQWISPAIINTGLATTVQGSDQVTVNAAAATVIDAGSATYSLITQRQFRIGAGTIYNIWDWDTATDTLTLDRPYGEASVADSAYQIYQCYYAAPYEDHLSFISVRDMQNFLDLCLTKTQEMLNKIDPQRSWYTFPTDVVYYQLDSNPDSVTYRYPIYELWGQPQYSLNYQLYGIRKGAELSANTDRLPPQVGEDCVLALAKYYAYQWAEANKGALPRNQGPDYKFLMGAAKDEYKHLYTDYRRRDRETVNLWCSVRKTSSLRWIPYYSTQSGMASPGAGFIW